MPYPWDPAVTFGVDKQYGPGDIVVVSATDPGAIGPGKVWVDTANGIVYYRAADNSAWVSTASAGGPPTGPAGGDLNGTYPNPTVKQVTFDGLSALKSTAGVTTLDSNPNANGEILIVEATSGQAARLRVQRHGDASPRIELIGESGTPEIAMGPGSGAGDIALARTAAGTFQVIPGSGEADFDIIGQLTFHSQSSGIYQGTVDPTAGGGVAAVQGSIYLRTNGSAYVKTGAGNTAWTLIATGSIPSSPTIVQSGQDASNGGGRSIVLGSAPTNGNLLIFVGTVAGGDFGAGPATTGVTWTNYFHGASGGQTSGDVWVGVVGPGASATTTFTSGGGVGFVGLFEVAGATASAAGAHAIVTTVGPLSAGPIAKGHLVAGVVRGPNTSNVISIPMMSAPSAASGVPSICGAAVLGVSIGGFVGLIDDASWTNGGMVCEILP